MSGTPPQPIPPLVSSARLRLIPITPGDAAEMAAGRHQPRWHREYPGPDDVAAASMVLRAGAPDPWGPRHVVHEWLAVGHIGFFGPPQGGEVEIGYGLVPSMRGQRLGREAVAAMLEATDRAGVRVRARVTPDNRVGLRMLAGAGFTELRGSDEDGRLVVARPLPRREHGPRHGRGGRGGPVFLDMPRSRGAS